MSKRKNNRVLLKEFLTIPIVLGTLLIISGAIGIYVGVRSVDQLQDIGKNAVNPLIEFQELSLELKSLANQTLKIVLSGRTESRKEVLESAERVNNLVNKKLAVIESGPQGNFFRRWVDQWTQFRNKMNSELDVTNSTPNVQELSSQIDKLINSISAIVLSIDGDMKETFLSAREDLNHLLKLMFALMALGLFLASATSWRVVCKLNGLFKVIFTGQQDRENLLNNLNQGFMVFDQNGIIQEGCTLAAHGYMGMDPTKHALHEVLQLDAAETKNMIDWYRIVFSETFDFDSMLPLAPKSFEKNNDMHIRLDYRPIYDPDTDKLDKVICIATDRTEECKLREVIETDVSNMFRPFEQTVKELAQKQDKKIDLYLLDSNIRIFQNPYRPLMAALNDAFKQVIESEEERSVAEKNEAVIIYVQFQSYKLENCDMMRILICDNGQQFLQLVFQGVGINSILGEAKKLKGLARFEAIASGATLTIEVPIITLEKLSGKKQAA